MLIEKKTPLNVINKAETILNKYKDNQIKAKKICRTKKQQKNMYSLSVNRSYRLLKIDSQWHLLHYKTYENTLKQKGA